MTAKSRNGPRVSVIQSCNTLVERAQSLPRNSKSPNGSVMKNALGSGLRANIRPSEISLTELSGQPQFKQRNLSVTNSTNYGWSSFPKKREDM